MHMIVRGASTSGVLPQIGDEGALDCRDAAGGARGAVRRHELLVLVPFVSLELPADVGGLEEGRGVCRDVEAHPRKFRWGPEVQRRAHCCDGRRGERPRHGSAQRCRCPPLAGHGQVGLGVVECLDTMSVAQKCSARGRLVSWSFAQQSGGERRSILPPSLFGISLGADRLGLFYFALKIGTPRGQPC